VTVDCSQRAGEESLGANIGRRRPA
jgi:hypothetical protein